MTTILLAIDVAPGRPLRHVSRAIDMTARLARKDTDRVIVLHVRNFSLARLGRTMRDQGGAPGADAVRLVVTGLRDLGIPASGVIRESDNGYVAQAILTAATEFGASLIVLGARERTDLPRIPLDMATHLLHISTLPVLIVPPGCDVPAFADAAGPQLPLSAVKEALSSQVR
jgi:nucleotide-binding universal stress UspA family protein